MNRAKGTLRSRLDWLFLSAVGVVLCDAMFFSIEYTPTALMHSAVFYCFPLGATRFVRRPFRKLVAVRRATKADVMVRT